MITNKLQLTKFQPSFNLMIYFSVDQLMNEKAQADILKYIFILPKNDRALQKPANNGNSIFNRASKQLLIYLCVDRLIGSLTNCFTSVIESH